MTLFHIGHGKRGGVHDGSGGVQPLNASVDLQVKSTSFLGIASYGVLTIGNAGIEYRNDTNERDYIQIPWGEVDHVSAPVMFKGRYLPRFTVTTRHDGEFAFSTRDNKGTLRAMRPYVGEDSLVRARSLTTAIAQCLKRVLGNLFRPSSHES